MEDKDRFYEETFLLANTNMTVVLDIPFLSLSNININFTEGSLEKLNRRSYITRETLSVTSKRQQIDKYKFAKMALDENSETFMVCIATFEALRIKIHTLHIFQITLLQCAKALTTVFQKYSDYTNIFYPDLAIKLPKNNRFKKLAIKFLEGKKLFYELLYALSLLELETLKVPNKTYLKTD